jgi:hypothetical protein
MKFRCKEISINDEELGCTITFSENIENEESVENKTIDEIMNSIGQYITLQRTYPENKHERDYYYFESSDFEKSGELKNFKIDISPNQFSMNLDDEVYEIEIGVTKIKFEEIKQVLSKIANGRGQINLTTNY